MVILIKKPKIDIQVDTSQITNHSGGGWGLRTQFSDTCAWMDSVFSDQECDSIINICNMNGLEKGHTFSRHAENKRKSYVHFIYPSPLTSWIFERLSAAVSTINENHFQFDLFGFNEGLQFTQYEAPSGEYDWHADSSMNRGVRKLSLSMLLNNPEEYEGGDLQLNHSGEPDTIEQIRGSVICFPSYTIHRVLPVTSGVRRSLVAWVTGPQFK